MLLRNVVGRSLLSCRRGSQVGGLDLVDVLASVGGGAAEADLALLQQVDAVGDLEDPVYVLLDEKCPYSLVRGGADGSQKPRHAFWREP